MPAASNGLGAQVAEIRTLLGTAQVSDGDAIALLIDAGCSPFRAQELVTSWNDVQAQVTELTDAALLIRSLAAGTPEGPWSTRTIPPPRDLRSADRSEAYMVTGSVNVARAGSAQDARYLAGMGRETGLALAEWLETEAHMLVHRGRSTEGHTLHALDVARKFTQQAGAQ